ncbi:MAG: Holliday junction resolvase RuvX [Candidatus Hydrogenedentes bacterium]|nr:Holliday junction resolvase RuvX [Candidatus Hydrogenedentota bacterium]
MTEQGIIIGLDVGNVRTGIARSDALQMMAFPYTVVSAKNEAEMAEAVAAEIRQIGPVRVVAGMPLDQYGQPGPQAGRVESLITRLRALLDVEIVTQDERFSTAEANRVARDMKVRGRKRKGKVDQIAATLILQTWLDRRASQRNTTTYEE